MKYIRDLILILKKIFLVNIYLTRNIFSFIHSFFSIPNTIEIYCDGSSLHHHQPCGIGWIIIYNGIKKIEGYKQLRRGNNNDAEISAAISAMQESIKYYKNGDKMTLYSDSQIMLSWANGSYKFKNENNFIQYDILRELVKSTNTKTNWIRGHAGHQHNERCDELAYFGRTGQWRNKNRF